MEQETDYEIALKRIRETEILAAGYYLITGLYGNKGINIARSNNGIVFEEELNDTIWYLVETNYD